MKESIYIIAVIVIACSMVHAGTDIHAQGRITYCTPERYAHPTLISFSNGINFDTRHGEPDLPEALRIDAYENIGYYLVQVTGPMQDTWMREIEAAGGKIAGYIPYYTLLVRADAAVKERIDDLPFVGWTGIFQPAYKLQKELFTSQGEKRIIVQVSSLEDVHTIAEYVARCGFLIDRIGDHPLGKSIQATGDMGEISTLAKIPGVLWMELWKPIELCNDDCQWVVQTGWQSSVPGNEGWRVWNEGVRGQGIVLSTTDSGINTQHEQFYDPAYPINGPGIYPDHRKIVAYKLVEGSHFGDDPYSNYHGSHVNGTVAGDDSSSGGSSLYDGMAIDARIYFVDIFDSAGNLHGTIPDDIDSIYLGNGLPYHILQHSGSWGAFNNQGTYISWDAEFDAYIWAHRDFLNLFAAGNEAAYRRIRNPGLAKNVLTIGATMNGTGSNQRAAFSSRGPAQDGRIKPTINAPGTNLWSVDGATTSAYKTMSGTSMATPASSGAVGLIRQYLLAGFYPSGAANPGDSIRYQSAALLRAMAIVSADPNIGSYVVPDSNIGWGRINVDSVLYFTGDARKLIIHDDTIGIGTGQAVEDSFRVLSSIPLRISMVWTDTAAAPNANPTIVNDLNLELIGPDGTSFRGNQYSGGQSIPDPGTWDNINVEECCRINSPQTGIWHVTVSGQQVVFGPQPYAYAITGNITPNTGITEMPGSQLLPRDIRMTVEPNPFTMQCIVKIQYALSSKHYAENGNSIKIELNVYDISGRVVKSFSLPTAYGLLPTEVNWTGRDDQDRALPSGVYFVQLTADEYDKTCKVLLVR